MTILSLRAKAEIERRRRGIINGDQFARYRFDPTRYIVDKLGWHPWAGSQAQPGQIEIIDAYRLALLQLHERHDFEQGNKTTDELRYWQPGQVIQNRIRIEAGHTIGKTKLASGIFSHFFDCFAPSIIYSFAPSAEQINDLLWKEIRTDRRNHRMPGRVLEIPELKYKSDHFAKGRATNNANNAGTERTQGQHGAYLMFILDEAEGVADYVYDAVESMTSGGMAIVIMLANPKTRTSRFYRQRLREDTVNFRISCLYHPNVLADKEIIPGAVRRHYVTAMMLEHAEEVPEHSADEHTFELPWQPGVVYKPDPEFMFRVLGIAPANIADNTFVPVGRYEAACNREPVAQDASKARIGVDVARYGADSGTVYIRWNGRMWRAHLISGQNTNTYRAKIKESLLWLREQGVTDVQIRIDGGGGYASGIIDPMSIDTDLQALFTSFRLFEVHNNATPTDERSYFDFVTQLYAEAGEAIKGIAIINAPATLEGDLTERTYSFANKGGVEVKRLQAKELFKKHMDRSPDDGDGFVLAAAPDYMFRSVVIPMVQGKAKVKFQHVAN